MNEQNALLDILLNPSAEAKELPLSLLVDITDTFSDELIIGRGGFGIVYKGVLHNEKIVAVKRLKINALILDDKEFYAEVNSMKKLKNKNIVRLLGYCIYTEKQDMMVGGKMVPVENLERLLCFEFAPNGTIKKEGASYGSNWQERFRTIQGICHGLECIHNAGYLHLDFKPDNILLDDNMVPKITDFGLSRFFGDQSTRNTMNKGGTLGYMAPEYMTHGIVSKKADIYSLGVVIFELVTGSKGPEVHAKTEEDKNIFLQKALRDWNRVLHRYETGDSLERASQQVETCIKIALNCTEENRDLRHSTKEITQFLDMALDPRITEALFVKDFGSVEDVDLHPSEHWILLSMSSGCIEILDYRTQESLGSIKLGDKPVHAARFRRGNDWNIVAGDAFGVMHVWCFSWRGAWTNFKTIPTTDGKDIRSVSVHPCEPYVLLSAGSSIMIWNTKDWTCCRMYHSPVYFKTVTRATFNKTDSRTFAIGCCDGTIKLWSHDPPPGHRCYTLFSSRRPYLVLHDHSEQVSSIDFFTCDDERFLATGSFDKTAKVWKYNTKERPQTSGLRLAKITEPEATLEHTGAVTATCYNSNLKIIITGTDDGVVTVWCSETYRRKRVLCLGLGQIHALSCSMGRRIFIGHGRGLLIICLHPKQQL